MAQPHCCIKFGNKICLNYCMCVISVFNYLLSIIILWGGRVKCRICKWKLLSVDRTFVAAFAQLTTFRDVGSSFSNIALTN